jgi:hypothetical protein
MSARGIAGAAGAAAAVAVGLAASLAGCPPRGGAPAEPIGGSASGPGRVAGARGDGGLITVGDGGVTMVGPAPAPPLVPPKPRPAKVKIVVRATPRAQVSWGKEDLGWTPVTLERPRDSGPVDLVVRADGYLPVHTRAYTFRNDSLSVRLTKVADKMSILGARKELPPEAPPDGGAAPPTLSPTPQPE